MFAYNAKHIPFLCTAILFLLTSVWVWGDMGAIAATNTYDPTNQTAELLYNEAQTVYLGNLERQAHGQPPLRWNRQLTHASRWFSWDSVENRPEPYCGHQDTNGEWPGDRARHFGYLGGAGAENAFCGYVTPQQAIDGWMNSPGHRDNLLAEGHREIGLGYYQRSSDGRGYVAQKFGHDAVYPPVIIENEAVFTPTPLVNLYIYDRSTGGGFMGFAPATQMMISNDPYFENGTWEPYAANKSWSLMPGSGWRSVYVKTRDAFNRTTTVSDSIYLGQQAPPIDQLGPEQMSSTEPNVTLYNLDTNWQRVQFSLGWLADDTFGTFGKLWGNGESVNDEAAWGGTAYRLRPGDGESSAWVWDTNFVKNTPMVAYFRLKVSDNSSPNAVGRISINGGGTAYGPLVLNGTDFSAANQYQEFAIPFTFHDSDDVFLIFQFWRSGAADLYVDAVSIFSVGQPVQETMSWSVPGGNYRGQGVGVRYTNVAGTQFSEIYEGVTAVREPELCELQSAIPEMECEALVAMHDANPNLSDWLEDGSSPCDWDGVICSGGVVTELDLVNRGIQSIPPEIAQLSNLQLLSLAINQLTAVPPEIGQLSNLTNLVLDSNQLTVVPPELWQLSNLESLTLSRNQFTAIPAEIRQLSNLKSLSLHRNQLTAIPREIGQLSNLQWLELWDNQLTTVPVEIGQLSNLRQLRLHSNRLTAVPPAIGQLNNLQRLYLNNNQLTAVPAELGQLHELVALGMSDNQLCGDLPTSLTNLTKITLPSNNTSDRLDVSHNHLTATDPTLLNWLNTYQPDWADTQTPCPDEEPSGSTSVFLPLITTPRIQVPLAGILSPFDAHQSDLGGPSATHYGKTPEIVVASDGSSLHVLAQDYNPDTPWKAVLLRIDSDSSGYYVSETMTDMPMLDRIMGLAIDEAGNRYYATAVDERSLVNPTYPPLNTYRNDIVRVVKIDPSGNVLFNIDLDTARHAYNNNAEMIINPMTFASARLAVGGNEIALVHGNNTAPDWNINGARHQKALSTRLDATTGAVTRVSSVWVSHSFDQRLLYDGEGIIEHHLGDAFPRHLVFGRNHQSYPLFHIKGALGDNFYQNTFTRLGNIALIENDSTYRYLALFATESNASTGSIINGPRNLAIVRVNGNDNSIDPNLPDTLTVSSSNTQQTNRLKWLTHYSTNSNLHAERPKLIGIGNNQFVVLWEEWRSSGNTADTFNGVYGMVIDSEGNIVRSATLLTNVHHLHRGDDAFLLNNRAGWLTGDATENKLYLHLVDASLNYELVVVE